MHTGEEIGINYVARAIVYDSLLVALHCIGLLGGEKRGPKVGEICAHRLRSQYGITRSDGTGKQYWAIEPFSDLLYERHR